MKIDRADASNVRSHTVIRAVVRNISGAAAALLLCAGAASAGSIATPFLFLGSANNLGCVVTNVSGAFINVRVKIVGVAKTTAQNCNIAPNDRGTCQIFLPQGGYCVISNNNLTDEQLRQRVRGALISSSTSAPFAVEAVVQAQ
jgi:hypothetical protein